MERLFPPEYEPAEFVDVHLRFVARSKMASLSDNYFYIIMSLEAALEFLKNQMEIKDSKESHQDGAHLG